MSDERGEGVEGCPVHDPVQAVFVGVLDSRNDCHALQLMKERARCVRRHDIHDADTH